MIYVRDDDVLIESSGHSDPFAHFKRVHSWICETDKVLHVPAILLHNVEADGSKGLLGFPEAVEFIKEETKAERMDPQIHGYEHIDYAKLPVKKVVEHLVQCQEYIDKVFGTIATRWYTPWGANAPHLYEAAEIAGLLLIDCSQINKLAGRHGVVQRLRDGEDPSFLEEQEIFFHWWEGGLRLKRAIEVIKHGSWTKAVQENEGNGLFE